MEAGVGLASDAGLFCIIHLGGWKVNHKEAGSYFDCLKQSYATRRSFYEKLDFPLNGAITFRDWEVLVAILLDDKAKLGRGCDLTRHEVKSAKLGNGFEYQYHRRTGVQKLEEDKTVDHVFVSYSNHYEVVEVRRVAGVELSPIFEQWRTHILDSYQSANPKQRCRHAISYRYVKERGHLLWTNVRVLRTDQKDIN